MINNKHPDFPKYRREFENLLIWRNNEYEKIPTPVLQTKDGPYGKVDKEFAQRFKTLQKKYHYLYQE